MGTGMRTAAAVGKAACRGGRARKLGGVWGTGGAPASVSESAAALSRKGLGVVGILRWQRRRSAVKRMAAGSGGRRRRKG